MKSSLKFTNFKSINLSNILYKIISKVLANQLKRVLNLIISFTLNVFIPSQLITNNILAVYENLHIMHICLDGMVDYMVVELDLHKAYNKVVWEFLKATIVNMRFNM